MLRATACLGERKPMPLIHLITTEPIPEATRQGLVQSLSRIAADVIGKPETYVMAIVQDGAAMLHAGKVGPAAFLDVRAIGGLSPRVCEGLAERVGALLLEKLQVPGDRVYLNFTEVPAAKWGHNGGTFG